MALLGIYVGVIPVSLGMLWLPFVRRLDAPLDRRPDRLHRRPARASWRSTPRSRGSRSPPRRRRLRRLQPGLRRGPGRLPGPGRRSTPTWRDDAIGSATRPARPRTGRRSTWRCWSRSGSASTTSARAWRSAPSYATGALALGAFLVVGFAIHNTTEGLAIVAPLRERRRGDGGGRARAACSASA